MTTSYMQVMPVCIIKGSSDGKCRQLVQSPLLALRLGRFWTSLLQSRPDQVRDEHWPQPLRDHSGMKSVAVEEHHDSGTWPLFQMGCSAFTCQEGSGCGSACIVISSVRNMRAHWFQDSARSQIGSKSSAQGLSRGVGSA